MKILFICNKSPYPHREGGPIAMNRMIEGMIAQGHQVKVLAINSYKYYVKPGDVPEAYREKTGLELIMLDLRLKVWDAFLNLFSKKSYHVQRFISKDFQKRIEQLVNQEQYDIVQMETLFVAPYMDVIRRASPKTKIVLRAHNIEYLIWERIRQTTQNPLKKLYLRHIVNTLKRYELNTLPHFDAIAAITHHDAAFIRKYNRNTLAVPFGINADEYPVSDPDTWEYPSLFHIGSMNWMPNEEGIRWFLDKVWPLVRQNNPALKLYLAGRHMPAWIYEIEDKNLIVLGEVDSAVDFMMQKGVMIVPLLSGSGIRIKIIEAMACGKPVVATSTGAEGIDVTHQEDIWLADEPEEFSEAIDTLVKDKQTAAIIGQKARKTIGKKYDNDTLMEYLTEFYKNL